MEVHGKGSIGKHVMEEDCSFTCQPCEEEGKCTVATGRCRECEENMCKTCFGHHRKAKVCKDHVLIANAHGTTKTTVDDRVEHDLEKCPHHFNELIKFYCPYHNLVGCGDCMILDHKMCKLDYIHEKAKVFKESEKFEEVIKDLNECDALKRECVLKITTKRKQGEDMHVHFNAEVEAYRNELLEHVNKLTNEIFDKAKTVHARNMEYLAKIENKIAERSHEISLINGAIESVENQPNKLFVRAIEHRNKIDALKRELGELKNNMDIEEYMFQRNNHTGVTIKECKTIGFVRSDLEDNIDRVNKSSEAEICLEVMRIQSMPDGKTQLLCDQKLRANNIAIDGDYLSVGNDFIDGVFDDGLFIGNAAMTTGSYFEVEITQNNSNNSNRAVGIGIVPDNYPRNAFPGWRKPSAGYHSDDGRIYIDQTRGRPSGPPCGNHDIMGCGIASMTSESVNFFFTRNGKMVGRRTLHTMRTLYPGITLRNKGQKVKVMLNAPMPKF